MNGQALNLNTLDRTRRRAGLAATILVPVCAILSGLTPTESVRSYLLAFVFWFGIAAGALGITMMHHLVGGEWGRRIRPILRSAASTLPLMAVLFLPLLLGIRLLYPWAGHETSHDGLMRFKNSYLTEQGYILRGAGFFAIWLVVWLLLWTFSMERKRTGDDPNRRLRIISGPGLVFFVFTMTFASIDWIMSLDPHWISPIYGISFVVGAVLLALAFSIIVRGRLMTSDELRESESTESQKDLGNLLLAFLMLWAYCAFSQYLIIWSANIPEEVAYYVRRTGAGWRILAWILILGHFLVPFLLLLSRWTKLSLRRLTLVAMLIGVMRLADIFWLIEPNFGRMGLRVLVMDLVMVAGVGCVWMFWFTTSLRLGLRRDFAMAAPAMEDENRAN